MDWFFWFGWVGGIGDLVSFSIVFFLFVLSLICFFVVWKWYLCGWCLFMWIGVFDIYVFKKGVGDIIMFFYDICSGGNFWGFMFFIKNVCLMFWYLLVEEVLIFLFEFSLEVLCFCSV